MSSKLATPPEESSWQRYSPHHELPLSSAASILLHALLLITLILGGFILTKAGAGGGASQSPQVGAVVVSVGAGGQSGSGTAKDHSNHSAGQERTALADETPSLATSRPTTEDLKDVPVKTSTLLEKNSADGNRTIEAAANSLGVLSATGEAARKRLDGLIARKGGHEPGADRPGSPGTPAGKLGPREERQRRWTLIFNTRDGSDYLKQLQALGAFLVIPKDDQYLVIRDLKRLPVDLKAEEIATIDRIYWIDDRPESVRSLTRALSLPFTPAHIAAFFPIELEHAMAEKELDYLRRMTPAGAESDIHETHFRVDRQGSGYAPRVVSQSLKR